jgi:hypothetical protein
LGSVLSAISWAFNGLDGRKSQTVGKPELI